MGRHAPCARNDGNGANEGGVSKARFAYLGGGPAGSVIARSPRRARSRRAARRPHGSRESGPRAESLAPSIVPILDSLQLRHDVDAAVFCRERNGPGSVGTRRRRRSSRWMRRPRFSSSAQLLDDSIARRGRRALQCGSSRPVVARAVRRQSGGEWLVPVATSDGPLVIKSRFLVDARGRRHHMCIDDGAPRTVALSAPWRACDRAYAETRIEAGSDEWLWGSPLAGRFLCRDGLSRFRAGRRASRRRPRTHCTATFFRARNFSRMLMRGKMIGPVGVRDATPRLGRDPIGNDFIRVGEASVSIDPLSSQGIQTALLSAIQGKCGRSHDPDGRVRSRGRRSYSTGNVSRRQRREAGWRRPVSIGSNRCKVRFGWIDRGRRTARLSMSSRRRRRPRAAIPTAGGTILAGQCRDQYLRWIHPCKSSMCRCCQARSSGARRRCVIPRLEQPIAYFSGVALAPLVREANGASTADQILRRWTRRMAPEAAWNIMTWMCAIGILVPHSARQDHVASVHPGSMPGLSAVPDPQNSAFSIFLRKASHH